MTGIEVQIPICVSQFPVNWDRNIFTFWLGKCIQEWYGPFHIGLFNNEFYVWIYGIEIVKQNVSFTFMNDAEDIIYIPFPWPSIFAKYHIVHIYMKFPFKTITQDHCTRNRVQTLSKCKFRSFQDPHISLIPGSWQVDSLYLQPPKVWLACRGPATGIRMSGRVRSHWCYVHPESTETSGLPQLLVILVKKDSNALEHIAWYPQMRRLQKDPEKVFQVISWHPRSLNLILESYWWDIQWH